MTRYFNRFLSYFVLVIVLLFSTPISSRTNSKTYSITRIQIEANILADGTLLIVESRTYHFRGSFSWADYELPSGKLGRVTDFSLTENDNPYQPQPGKEPGTYSLSQDENKFYVKWYYRARNESRTFTLKYRVEDAVTVYNDVAEFYYQFVSGNRQATIGMVDVTLSLPEFADTSQVRAWAHGPLHGQLAFEEGKIHLRVSPLPRRNWWEIRAIFPPAWVASARNRQDGLMKEKIMTEERLLVEESNAQRLQMKRRQEVTDKYKPLAFQGSIILAVMGLGAFILLYNRYGQANPTPFQGRISSEIPQDVSPALANYIYYSRQMGAGAMVATLFNLASRGYLKIEESIRQKKLLWAKYDKKIYQLKLIAEAYERDKNDLASHERDLVDFLFTELAPGRQEIMMDEIKDSRRDVKKWFKNLKKIIEQEWGQHPFYEKSSIIGTVISAVISVVILTAGIFIGIRFGSAGIIAIVAGALLLGCSFVILKYTTEVKSLKERLSLFRKYLTRYSFRRESGYLQSNLDRYLIYGIALGIGSKVIKEMINLAPGWQSTSYFGWYVASSSHGTPVGFAESVSGMVSAVSTTMGSAAGIGGGASAGGGAGAGGASGGAG